MGVSHPSSLIGYPGKEQEVYPSYRQENVWYSKRKKLAFYFDQSRASQSFLLQYESQAESLFGTSFL